MHKVYSWFSICYDCLVSVACRRIALAILASTICAPAAVRAEVYISDGDRVGRYTNAGVLVNPNFINLNGVTGLAIGPDGHLYAATAIGNNWAPGIFRFDANTGAQIDVGPFVGYEGDPPTPDPHDVIDPQGLAFGPNGHLYVADINGSTNNVHEYDSAGNSIASLSSPSVLDPGGPLLIGPRAVAFRGSEGPFVTSSDSVLQYDSGTQTFSVFTQGGGVLNDAKDLAFGPGGDLYVLDWSVVTPQVLHYNSDGSRDLAFMIDFAPTTFYPAGLAVGPDNKIYISGYDALDIGGEVLRFNLDGSPDGIFISTAGGNPLTYQASFMVITPEPTTILLASLAGTAAIARRRRARSIN